MLARFSILFLLSLLTAQAGSDWPQFRGPGGLGVGTGTPPVEFGDGRAMRWKVELPPGHSSPCIHGDRLALTALADDRLVTICLDRATGRELWRKAAPAEKIEPAHRISSPASPTPCTDGERLVSYFGSYGVIAYDWEGRELWKAPLPPPIVEFGTSASPIFAEGKIILAVDQDVGAHLLALDAKTGAEIWRTPRPEFRRSFSTPFVWKHDGGAELVVAGSLWVRGYELATGRELWSSRGVARVSNASPFAVDGLLIVSSWNAGGDPSDRVVMAPFAEFAATQDANKDGSLTKDEIPAGPLRDRFSQMDADKDGIVTPAEYEFMRDMFADAVNQIFAIKPGGRGDITTSHVAWEQTKHLPYVSSPVAIGGRLFTMKNGGLASCYEARTGRPIFHGERVNVIGDFYSSGVAAGGRVYFASQKGVVVVLDAATDELRVLARNDLREQIFATPAIVDGTLYVRTEKHLFAFGE